MKKILTIWALLCCCALKSSGHPMPNSLVNIHVADEALTFELNIPFFDLQTVLQLDSADFFKSLRATDHFQSLPTAPLLEGYFLKHLKIRGINGVPWSLGCTGLHAETIDDPLAGPYAELRVELRAVPPPGADLRHFMLYYDVILHQIVTHQAIISIARDWENGIHEQARQLAVVQVDTENNQTYPVIVQLEAGGNWKGFKAMFQLGMRHIAEGTDHLMFLLLLLFVAPLALATGRWEGVGSRREGLWRLLKIVTAFTVGHSITLAAGALGWRIFPTPWVESAVAFSILVSALHALKPLFYARETWVAGGFGLIHGMAFSDTLTQLKLEKAQLLLSLLGFNAGIEAFQLLIAAVCAPVLFALCRTKYYTGLRIAVAMIGIAASVFWMGERLGLIG